MSINDWTEMGYFVLTYEQANKALLICLIAVGIFSLMGAWFLYDRFVKEKLAKARNEAVVTRDKLRKKEKELSDTQEKLRKEREKSMLLGMFCKVLRDAAKDNSRPTLNSSTPNLYVIPSEDEKIM